jgi:hypothetical protein
MGKGKGAKEKGREGKDKYIFFAVVLLFSQFPCLELDMINNDVLLLYVSLDHKRCDWFPGSA